jgi:hypothetical protein
MKTLIEQNAAEPEGYVEYIKRYVQYALNDLEGRFRQVQEETTEKSEKIWRLKLLDPSNCVYSPVTLLTGDTAGSSALFMRTLQLMALEKKKKTTVIVPQGQGVEIANSLVSQEARVDITSDKRAWTDSKYLASIFKEVGYISKSEITIVDAPSLNSSLARASCSNSIDYIFVTGFPENDSVEELKTLKGFGTGRKIPVLVLNTGEPIDPKDLWEHIDTYYHMEVGDDFEYLLTAESKRLKAKEEATVTLNPTKKWIHAMESKRVYSMKE